MSRSRPRTLSTGDQLLEILNNAFITETSLDNVDSLTTYPYSSSHISNMHHMRTSVSLPVTPLSSSSDIDIHNEAAAATITTVADDDNSSTDTTIIEEYQPCTLGEHNMTRLSVLPIFPPVTVSSTIAPAPATFSSSSSSSSSSITTTMTMTSSSTSYLLLANIPSKMFTEFFICLAFILF